MYAKKEKLCPAYVSKHNSNSEKQVILLMVLNGPGWHYLAVKTSAFLGGITSKHHGDFYCQNCLHSLATKKKRKFHKKICENKDFCNVLMPSEDTKILEFNQIKNLIKHHLLFMQILNV